MIFKTIKEVKTGAAVSTAFQIGMILCTCSSISEVAVPPMDCGPSLVIPVTSESFELYFLMTYMFSSEGTSLLFETSTVAA